MDILTEAATICGWQMTAAIKSVFHKHCIRQKINRYMMAIAPLLTSTLLSRGLWYTKHITRTRAPSLSSLALSQAYKCFVVHGSGWACKLNLELWSHIYFGLNWARSLAAQMCFWSIKNILHLDNWGNTVQLKVLCISYHKMTKFGHNMWVCIILIIIIIIIIIIFIKGYGLSKTFSAVRRYSMLDSYKQIKINNIFFFYT